MKRKKQFKVGCTLPLFFFFLTTEQEEEERKIWKASHWSTDAVALFDSLRLAYSAIPTTLKKSLTQFLIFFLYVFKSQIIDLYIGFAVSTTLIQNYSSGLSASCIGTAVLAVCLRIQANKENKEFKDLAPERAFADFILCNLVLHLVIVNSLG
ncbi:dolichyl-diphosphooligosaccharide--protein glycosyltransferase subunit DAD1 [Pyrus ussuriensis x Pyrus communis]|uniref:Dolichyl-diphosphooligosaccharide--protein glycosyltransferase subunit DAD1 n=1 Tax=Pyrus ussuriensis x Pyrus communis TaxID=2448454 RepID=A0A5N5I5L4_9ROSA|nr:dolichyl-diphosphooligosaccharide--protein glycosyltransferase subunit DAD1 [Pyrus ussuriensis x Pyrus communis]